MGTQVGINSLGLKRRRWQLTRATLQSRGSLVINETNRHLDPEPFPEQNEVDADDLIRDWVTLKLIWDRGMNFTVNSEVEDRVCE